MSLAGVRALTRASTNLFAKRFAETVTARSTTSDAIVSVISEQGRVRVAAAAATAGPKHPIFPSVPRRGTPPPLSPFASGLNGMEFRREELARKAAVLKYMSSISHSGFGNRPCEPEPSSRQEQDEMCEPPQAVMDIMCINSRQKLRSWKHKMARGKHMNKWGRGANPRC